MSSPVASNVRITRLEHGDDILRKDPKNSISSLVLKDIIVNQPPEISTQQQQQLSPRSINTSMTRSRSASSLEEAEEESYMSLEGQIHHNYSSSDEEIEKKRPVISKFRQLISEIDSIYKAFLDWDIRKEKLQQILERSDLSTKSVNKFTHWDLSKSYTRNLCHSTDEYTLLILCWSPGKESKIHNHPSQSCFIKTLRGCIREVVYGIDEDKDHLQPVRTRFYNEGQVSWMSDSIGLHKIGNPSPESGSVTLHLYTPPFSECKVWNSSTDNASNFEVAKMGFFSVMGLRTPQLEGKKGKFALLMQELKAVTSQQTQSIDTMLVAKESFVDSDDGRSYESDDEIEDFDSSEDGSTTYTQCTPCHILPRGRLDCF